MDGSVASARDKIDEIGQQIQTKQLIKKQCSAYRAFREIVENEKIPKILPSIADNIRKSMSFTLPAKRP